MRTPVITLIAALAAVAAVSSAHADPFSIDATVGGAPTGVNYVNFDDLPLGSAGGTTGGVTVSFQPDAQVVQGSSSGFYAAPYLSNGNGAPFGDNADGPDTTSYIASGSDGGSNPNAAATITFAGPEMYVGLLWGSVDAYNTLSFYDGSTLIGAITGSDVTGSADGDQGADGTYYVNINSSVAFTSVVATSSEYAFEFDNVAYGASNVPVPEPASLALLGLGLAGIGFARRRRA